MLFNNFDQVWELTSHPCCSLILHLTKVMDGCDIKIYGFPTTTLPLDKVQNSFFMEIMDVVSHVGCKTTNPLDLLANFHRFFFDWSIVLKRNYLWLIILFFFASDQQYQLLCENPHNRNIWYLYVYIYVYGKWVGKCGWKITAFLGATIFDTSA